MTTLGKSKSRSVAYKSLEFWSEFKDTMLENELKGLEEK
jgi:hypothetical protein